MDDKIEDKKKVLAESKEPLIVDSVDKIESEEDKKEDSKLENSVVVSVDSGDEASHSAQPDGVNKMKNNPNEQPYDQKTEVKRTTSDDSGTIAMVLGIIAIVCSIAGMLSLVGLVLGIIAIVKGSRIRKISSPGMAGWVLGIIAVAFSGIKIFIGLAFLAHAICFAPMFM